MVEVDCLQMGLVMSNPAFGAREFVSISVVIPCFNCRSTIARAIGSVLAQTKLPAEVILVDDASSDQTFVCLQEFEAKFPEWIVLIRLDKNGGAANARNVGWSRSAKKFIAFLDADDSWHPEKICIQYEFMLNNPNIALSGHQCLFSKKNEIRKKLSIENIKFSNIELNYLVFKNAFSTPTVMLKRELGVQFCNGRRYAEDLLLWQQVASLGFLIVRIEVPLAYVHKDFYGAEGLSANLWAMEVGELDNLKFLHRSKKISPFIFLVGSGFSVLKFIRRTLVGLLRKLRT
jgi:hypothetical protein